MLWILIKIVSHASAKKKKMAHGFQISHCYWSFSSNIMAVKWLNIFSPQLEDREKSPSPLSAKEQSEMLASEDEMRVVAGGIDINDILQQVTDDTLGSFMAALTRVSVHEEIIYGGHFCSNWRVVFRAIGYSEIKWWRKGGWWWFE